MPRKLAVISDALDSDFRRSIAEARKLGFDGVQLPRSMPGLHLPDLSATGRRELATLLRGYQLQLIGLRFEIDKHGFGPGADIDASIHRIESMLELARSLDAKIVCLDIGPLPEKAEDAHGHDKALAELGNRADRFGVPLAFGNELTSFAAMDRALRAAGCPWFGMDLNPVAILRDEWSEDKIFSRLGNKVLHVRGRDAVAGADRRTRPAVLYMGSFKWPRFLSRLDESGYQGWLTVDPMELPDPRAATIVAMNHLCPPKE